MHHHHKGSVHCNEVSHKHAAHNYVYSPKGRFRYKRPLIFILTLSMVFLFVEIIAGFLTNSLALLSDAGHLFTDVGSMLLALFAMWIASFPSNSKKTFGYFRMEILAALFNGVTLILIALFILFEAGKRIIQPSEVHASGMMIVAILGFIINLLGMFVLREGHHENMNLHGVFLHLMGDALGSLGAIIAGIIMALTKWYYADTIVSIFIALIIIFSSAGLVNHAVNVLLEGVPHGICSEEITFALQKIPGVVEVHDLHIWALTSGIESLSAHVLIEDPSQGDLVLKDIHTMLGDKFNINHVTVQIEKDRLAEPDIH